MALEEMRVWFKTGTKMTYSKYEGVECYGPVISVEPKFVEGE